MKSDADDILKIFDSVHIDDTNQELSKAIYFKLEQNYKTRNNMIAAAIAGMTLLILNMSVYQIVFNNDYNSNTTNYSKADLYYQVSEELLVTPLQTK